MSWEAFVPAGVAAAAAAASPAPPGRSEAALDTLSSPMPWMLHVPATAQELAERVGPPLVGTAPIWQLAASSGTLHDPPEKKCKINPDALLIMNGRWRRKCTRESIVFDMRRQLVMLQKTFLQNTSEKGPKNRTAKEASRLRGTICRRIVVARRRGAPGRCRAKRRRRRRRRGERSDGDGSGGGEAVVGFAHGRFSRCRCRR